MSRLLLLFVIALLAACGQKGPLYRPAPVSSPAVSVPDTPTVGPAQVVPVPAVPGAAEGVAPAMAVPPAPVVESESESRERALPAAQP